ncbi:MAG: hypothetical protein RL020_1547 [Pseudomonadota bacterium]|jgi:uncharacterized protein (DUF2147 family)
MNKYFSLILLFGLFATHAHADSSSIIGAWKSIDDGNGKPRSIVRISESGGMYEGAIEKLFPEPNEDANPKCDKCQGELKDKPILGMKIINQMKKHEDEYKHGTIMDPDNGKIYKCKLWLEDGGKKLKVRGYIGPLFRTQTWLREE